MKTQAKQLVATEKRILTPSGRLQQVAALVYRREMGALQVLVITSRGTGRWIIPKGWPQVGRTLAGAALREAFEEAGIRGDVSHEPIGSYIYCKMDLPPERINQFTVAVYAVQFTSQEKDWPEREQRLCEWVSPGEAANRVEEVELKQILNGFADSGFAAAAE
ncbi:NUDIX hydrolase [Brucella sp. 6810]|uniref:NUDIX hydrolase n=1 Tax=unclassified Brucella TaxID=2632610 RepID=UPI0012959F69|nr:MULTISPECIES: NUDIX hydrolase [unclassified Brucella]QGA55791.1 NUDIX domain-containing protein [Brucella sp. 2280]QNQ62588.1 NUDIX hydrolase [Brucella sp. 6810]